MNPAPNGSDRCARALDRFTAVLEEERKALRAMDAPRVVLAAQEKELCLGELVASGLNRFPEFTERFAALVQEQHRNLRMLIYARECVHDALMAAGAVAPGYGRGKPQLPPGATIDVRG